MHCIATVFYSGNSANTGRQIAERQSSWSLLSLEAVRYFWKCHGEHAPCLSATTRPCLHFHLRIFLSTGLKEQQGINLAAILVSETENMDAAHLNGKPAAGLACRIRTKRSTGEVYAFVADAASSGAKSAERF